MIAMPYWYNAALLAAEGLLYFVAMTALFRARHRIGVGVFYCALGTMHFLETYLAAVLYLQFPLGITLSPGSVVLFSGKLVMLLLVFIREDAAAVRQPIYGLLAGNFLMVALVWVMRYHDIPAVGVNAPDFGFMDAMGGLMLWGTTLLFLDAVLLVLLYQRLGAWLGDRQWPRIVISAAVILTFDQVGFFLALRWFLGVPWEVLAGGWTAKMFAAAFFGSLAALYLRYIEPVKRQRAERGRALSDIFDTLTYRHRYEALLRQTGRDALTGLLDRGRFDREAAQAVADATAARWAISLMIVDLDHFKSFNDRFGYESGDEVLRRVARAIQDAVRDGDRIYRHGGEEFVVLCDGLNDDSAMLIAERLRRAVSTIALDAGQVTVSIGVATGPDEGETLATLFGTADARLNAAKAQGRDRAVGRVAELRARRNNRPPGTLAPHPA